MKKCCPITMLNARILAKTTAQARRIAIIVILLLPMGLMAQIGVGTTTPHPSSMMHISPGAGNNKGFILPKITSGSRVVLDSTQNIAHGLIFFDTDLQKYYYFHQSPRQWFELDHDWIRKDIPGASPVVGNHIYSGVTGNVGIGTGTAFDPTEKLTVVGNVSIGAAAWAQDSNITTFTSGALAVDNWIGINTITRTGGVEFDVKGQANISSTLTVGGDVTANKFNGLGIVPIGTVVMWSGIMNTATNFDADGAGVVGTQYEGWQLCNGFSGSPDLRGRFIVGALEDTTRGQVRQSGIGTEYNNPDYWRGGLKGGEREHTLTIAEMPAHDHNGQTGTDGDHSHNYNDRYRTTADIAAAESCCNGTADDGLNDTGRSTSTTGAHDHNIDPEGGGNPHENRPPYYVLAFIIRKQ
jgi:microcystin-dependent protein